MMREVSKKIKERTVEKDITFINEGKDLNGNLLFAYNV
jgi:hypothetical protein